MGLLAESGWAHHDPDFLLCPASLQATDLELGSPGCPLLVIPDNDHT